MTKKDDQILILGGGLTGLSAGYILTKAGLKVGRMGMFKYYNMDHAIDSGMRAADKILGRNKMKRRNGQLVIGDKGQSVTPALHLSPSPIRMYFSEVTSS